MQSEIFLLEIYTQHTHTADSALFRYVFPHFLTTQLPLPAEAAAEAAQLNFTHKSIHNEIDGMLLLLTLLHLPTHTHTHAQQYAMRVCIALLLLLLLSISRTRFYYHTEILKRSYSCSLSLSPFLALALVFRSLRSGEHTKYFYFSPSTKCTARKLFKD